MLKSAASSLFNDLAPSYIEQSDTSIYICDITCGFDSAVPSMFLILITPTRLLLYPNFGNFARTCAASIKIIGLLPIQFSRPKNTKAANLSN
jgi:hypothetical protein